MIKAESNVTASDQALRAYQAPTLIRLSLTATEGGHTPTCDAACGVADNTFPGGPVS